jgi:peptidoglycan/LPS O-acetylase OafA/YrhL
MASTDAASAEPAAIVPAHARFPLVDAVRAFAAFTIFAYHVAFHLQLYGYDTLGSYLGNLNIGVPVFFVVSGFLLYRPFVAARLGTARSVDTGPYAIRRLFRIVPAYWVALILIAAFIGTDPGQTGVFTPGGIVRYFGFLQIYSVNTYIGGIGQAWSLCVEITFYIVLPLWAFAARRVLPGGDRERVVRWELVALGGLFLFGVAFQLGIERWIGPEDAGWATSRLVLPNYADQFAVGMAAAVISAGLTAGMRPPAFVRLIGRAAWLPLLLAVACFGLLGQLTDGLGNGIAGHLIFQHELRAVIGVLILAPAVFGVEYGGLTRRMMGLRPVLWFGLISYSFYLWHLTIIGQVNRIAWLHDLGWEFVAVGAFAVATLVAFVSFRFVERPGIAAGRRLSQKRKPSAPSVPSA